MLAIAACLAAACWAGPEDAPGSLLIVTPAALRPPVEEYAQARRADLPVEVAALDEALAGEGADDPERLKRWLHGRWRASLDAGRPIRYVLLVGDADAMPVRYMVLDRVTPAAFDYAFYPSDLYYADLAKPGGAFDDWNAAKGEPGSPTAFHAAYYGEVRGEKNKTDPINFDAIDYRPDVALGRWPVGTPEEVRAAAAKSLAFAAAAAGRPRAALIASGGWVENRPQMDALARALVPAWAVEKRYFRDDARDDGTPPPDEAGLVGLLNGGTRLVLHSGHGEDHGWHGCLGTGSLAKLTNAAAPAVMFSAGCSTARFATLPPYEAYRDIHGREHAGTNAGQVFTEPPPPPAPYQPGRFNPPGLGEQLLRAGPTGAAAYIGCNTGSQPCGMTLLAGFAAAAGGGAPVRLGDCWAHALRHYYDAENLAAIAPTEDWYPASIFFQGMKFMLFGDPSLPLVAPGETR